MINVLKVRAMVSKGRLIKKRAATFLICTTCFMAQHTKAQNVGIGTGAPTKRLSVNGSILLDATNKNNGTLDSAALLFGDGGDLGIAGRRNSGWNDLMFFTGGTQRLRIASNGSVLVNTANNVLYPYQFVALGQSLMENLWVYQECEANKLRIDSSIVMSDLLRASLVAGNIKIGQDIFNGIGKLQINGGITVDNGDARFRNSVAIGTNATMADHSLHVSGQSFLNGNLNMNAVNPTIQLKQEYENKGFLQLSGDNVRIGTNSGNSAGNFVIRNNGGDRVTVDAAGNMDVQGNLTINDDKGVLYNTHGSAPLKYYTRTATFTAILSGHAMSAEGSFSFPAGIFTTPPKVFAGDIVTTGGTTGELFRVQLVLYGVTTTGCKARLINTSPNPVNYSITWNIVCIGE